MRQEEWASLQHALQLLVTQFLRDEVSVFVLLNFVTSMYALGAFCTKVCSFPSANLPLPALTTLACVWSRRTLPPGTTLCCVLSWLILGVVSQQGDGRSA